MHVYYCLFISKRTIGVGNADTLTPVNGSRIGVICGRCNRSILVRNLPDTSPLLNFEIWFISIYPT